MSNGLPRTSCECFNYRSNLGRRNVGAVDKTFSRGGFRWLSRSIEFHLWRQIVNLLGLIDKLNGFRCWECFGLVIFVMTRFRAIDFFRFRNRMNSSKLCASQRDVISVWNRRQTMCCHRVIACNFPRTINDFQLNLNDSKSNGRWPTVDRKTISIELKISRFLSLISASTWRLIDGNQSGHPSSAVSQFVCVAAIRAVCRR